MKRIIPIFILICLLQGCASRAKSVSAQGETESPQIQLPVAAVEREAENLREEPSPAVSIVLQPEASGKKQSAAMWRRWIIPTQKTAISWYATSGKQTAV